MRIQKVEGGPHNKQTSQGSTQTCVQVEGGKRGVKRTWDTAADAGMWSWAQRRVAEAGG